jgi:hypothetical protein
MVTKGNISLFVKRQQSLIVRRQQGAGPSPDLPASSYLCGDAILIICAISAIDKPGQGESPLRMSLPGDFPRCFMSSGRDRQNKDAHRESWDRGLTILSSDV